MKITDKNKKYLIIGGSVLLVGGLGYWLYTRNQKKKALDRLNREQLEALSSGSLSSGEITNSEETAASQPSKPINPNRVNTVTIARVPVVKMEFRSFNINQVKGGSFTGSVGDTLHLDKPLVAGQTYPAKGEVVLSEGSKTISKTPVTIINSFGNRATLRRRLPVNFTQVSGNKKLTLLLPK